MGVMTNGNGIIRNIAFFDDDFKNSYSDIISKKSNNPDLDIEISDSHSLKTVLSDFFSRHPELSYSTFLADSAFDSYVNYTMLKDYFSFKRVCIPLNNRNSKNSNSFFDEYGTQICPLDKTPFVFSETVAVKIVRSDLNGFAINLFLVVQHAFALAKIHSHHHLTESALIRLPIRILEINQGYQEIPNIGIIFTKTEYTLKELSLP